MSFNDIAEFRLALGRITRDYSKLINAGHRSLLWVIISYPEGCFIGLDELADQAGLSNDTAKAYLRHLTKLSLISREQSFARKGLRQCYRVILHNLTNFNRVLPDTPFNNSSMGVTKSVKGVAELANGSYPIHPYKENKYYKNDKESFKGINKSRFDELLSFIPKEFHIYIDPGKNIEVKLDEVERRETTLKGLGSFLKAQQWTTSNSKGGLLNHFLDVYLGYKKLGESESMTSWCGKCDESTRTFQEASEVNGKDDYRCTACNDQLLNEHKRIKAREAQAIDLQELTKNMFKGPNDY